MDRRIDQRYPANLDVTVTDIAAPDQSASGQIVDISRSGVCANLSLRFAAGAVVKAQLADCVLFGHVVYSNEGPWFRTGIEVVRVLMGESDLSRLLNGILAETMPGISAVKS
jgi:hypothetical protein